MIHPDVKPLPGGGISVRVRGQERVLSGPQLRRLVEAGSTVSAWLMGSIDEMCRKTGMKKE